MNYFSTIFAAVSLLVSSLFATLPATAQVTTDGTTSTTVNAEGDNFTIEQGDRAGGNLFHSFSDFSVPTGGQASFNNAADVENILSRVTGGNISNINGLVRANGGANLFLINPAGIVFGEGASLNIGGSFYGSSADSVLFEDGEFSATDLANPPVLTINAPIGLGFRDNPQSITNRSQVNNGNGLQVNIGKNITLLGGDINFDGGRIFAPGSNVELGGLSAAGEIGINSDDSLSFPDVVARSDVSFANGSIVNVTSGGGGNIIVNARNFELLGSTFLAGIDSGLGSPDAQAGDININATDNISLDGQSNNLTAIGNTVFDNAIGNAGEINISARNISLSNGGQIQSFVSGQGNGSDITLNAKENISIKGSNDSFNSTVSSFIQASGAGNSGTTNLTAQNLTLSNGGSISSAVAGVGDSGDININARDSLAVDGEAIFADGTGPLPSKISSNLGFDTQGNPATGNSGDININTTKLSLTNGGQINTSTFGIGNAGNIDINSTESVTLDGRSSRSFSGINSNVQPTAEGTSGDIEIATNRLSVTNGGSIDTNTLGIGNSGKINIDATNLSLNNGSEIRAGTAGIGNAGNISINVTELVSLDGGSFIANLVNPSAVGDGGIINITTPNLALTNGSAIISTIQGEGDGGAITLTTIDTVLNSGSTIDSSSFGTGNGGSVFVKADTLSLDDGLISAVNVPAESLTENEAPKVGGNITLEIAKSLSLQNNSIISAQAGSNSTGGNVDINANFIVAFPDGANDIRANATQGQGGNIDITAKSVFGIEERPLSDFTNDINASSESNLDGTVSLSILETNALQGTTELPTNVIQPQQTTEQACAASRETSKPNGLTVNGKGGIPPAPELPLNSQTLVTNGQENSSTTTETNQAQAQLNKLTSSNHTHHTSQGDITPAEGVVATKDGRVILTAYPTDANSRVAQGSANCGM